ncbi:phytanoyl-CoA dioxygenase family protein [Novosphingobium sp. ERW19]|nr:phytanoyl-CoA dioxygenase family protein [Novosphingobium sp. ERW19]
MDGSDFGIGQLLPIQIQAGSMIFFNALLMHRSDANRSFDDWRALPPPPISRRDLQK